MHVNVCLGLGHVCMIHCKSRELTVLIYSEHQREMHVEGTFKTTKASQIEINSNLDLGWIFQRKSTPNTDRKSKAMEWSVAV